MHGTAREEVLRRLQMMISAAKIKGITLLHENEKGIYGDTPERCLDLFNTFNSPNFRATFDPANFIQCGRDPIEAYEILRGNVEYFHVKDALKDKNNNVPAGYGDGEIQEILKRIDSRGGKMFVSLEPHLTVFEGFGALEQNDEPEPELSKDGIEKFKIAYEAFYKILKKIKTEV
jgi:sugar phosphate isomerase/epimerase